MAELAQVLSSIEDWESYQVATSAISDESDKTIEEGSSVAGIKEGLSDALSVKLDSEVDPNRLPQLEKLHRAFKVWRRALDDKEEKVPHLLICLLNEDYGDAEVEDLNVSLLKGIDRILLCRIAPVAKAYGFNLHFGEAKYMESGYPKTAPRNNSDTRKHKENEMDVDSDDDSRSEESFVELEEMDYDLDMNDQDFSVDNVTKMNGFPLKMTSSELREYEIRTGDARRRLIINGDVTDRKPRFEFDDYIEPYDRLHVLNQTWSSRCLLISPNDTDEVEFSPSTEVVAYACTLLSISRSTMPTAQESEIANLAIKWLSKNLPWGDTFKLKRLTSVLCNCAIQWSDEKLFADVLRFCGERKMIGTIVGVEPLVAGCQVFQWSEINNWYDQAVTNDLSIRFRYELVKQILAGTTDDNIIAWGNSRIATFIDNLGKVEVDDIEAVVSWLRSQSNPVHILRDRLMPRLSVQQSDDMKVWTALFSRIHDGPDGSGFNKAELLSVIQDTLQRMADTVDPLGSHVVSLVELCARYDVMAALDSVFRRMWDEGSRQNSRLDFVYQLNTTLIPGFDGLAEKDPRMKEFLTRVFFGQAFEHLLSDYSANKKSSLKKAAQYLDDPVEILLKCVTPERVKVASKTKYCSLALNDLMNLIHSYIGQAQPSGHVLTAKLQNIHRLCLEERIASTDYSSLTKERPSQNSIVIALLDLCIKAGYPDVVPRVLENCLNAPESKRPEYATHGLYNAVRALPSFLERHGIQISSAEASVSRIAPYIHFADETVKKILSRPEGLTPDLCGEVARNPLFSSTTRTELQQAVQNRIANIGPNLGISPQDLKGVGCGCSDCDRFLVPVFTQNRGPKVGISVKGRDAAKSILKNAWRGHVHGVLLGNSSEANCRPSGLISLQQWLPSIQEAKKMVEALGLPQALSAAYARMTEAISNANAGQKRPIDVDGDVANKRARTA